jgi:nucleotide-binding universal stress UspA family protein
MNQFQNILYVSHGLSDDTEALRQTLHLAVESQARMTVLIVYPGFPDPLQQYQQEFETSRIQRVEQALADQLTQAGIPFDRARFPVAIAGDRSAALCIIRHVLRDSHDLLIKTAESHDGNGFKAIDMELLRKCPSPVWLWRAHKAGSTRMRIAVAADPINEQPVGDDLAIRLLALADSLARHFDAELHIICCWDYPYEEYLQTAIDSGLSPEVLQRSIFNEQRGHRAALDARVHKASIREGFRLHHVRGKPEQVIPAFVACEHIDLIVMGTVARTGIPGLIMGNTAENILQKLDCSLLALKPAGFITPVRL